jgi:integrase
MAEIVEKLPAVTDEQWKACNDFNRKITEEFILESTQLSEKTLEGYYSALKIFFNWVRENIDNISLLDIKGRDYLKFQNYLVRRGMSSSAIKFKRASISSLNGYIITFYEDKYPMFKNFITKKIANPPKAFTHEKKPMNKEEWDLLISKLVEQEEWQKIAYLKFTYASGCRRAESRQLLKEIVDYQPIVKNKDGKEIIYYQTHEIRCKGKGKVGKVRKLQLDQEAMDAIKKWLEIRGEDDCPFIFISHYDKKINQVSPQTFNRWCMEFGEIIGRRVHPHQMREQRATDLVVGEGKDIKKAQKLLGHEQSSTTEIYVIRNEDEDIDDVFA